MSLFLVWKANTVRAMYMPVSGTYAPSKTPMATTVLVPDNRSLQALGEGTDYGLNPPTTREIEQYIKQVFGKHSWKALTLLRGRGPSGCAENRGLDINAMNDNTTWGGRGRDWGLFQINDYYHPVKELNIDTNWRANVNYAWRMFKNDNYSFRRWTAGRCMGI